MRIITNKDQDWLQRALKTKKPVKLRGKLLLPDAGAPSYLELRMILFDDYPAIQEDNMCSVTSILNPLRISWYMKNKPDDMVIDITLGSSAMIGTAIHRHAEEANKYYGDGSAEIELRANVGDYILRGIADNMEGDLISDYKGSTCQQMKPFGDALFVPDKPEYIAQIKMLMWLARKNDHKIDKGYIAVVARDHTLGNTFTGSPVWWNPDPHNHVYNYDPSIEEYINKRVPEYFNAVHGALEDVPMCEHKDRWPTDEGYKVYKKGGKRCINNGSFLVKTHGADASTYAQRLLHEKGSNYEVRHVQQGYMRCERYCPARMICESGSMYGKT